MFGNILNMPWILNVLKTAPFFRDDSVANGFVYCQGAINIKYYIHEKDGGMYVPNYFLLFIAHLRRRKLNYDVVNSFTTS